MSSKVELTGVKSGLKNSDTVVLYIDRQLSSSSKAATAGSKQSSRLCSIQRCNGIVSTHLQHVEQSCLSGIVETEEKQLRVLVKQSQGGQHIVDYSTCQPIQVASDAL